MSSDPGLQERLRRHVDVLAELIGERNSVHPTAIEAAREYLHRELREMGHKVLEHAFSTSSRRAVNLEVILRGSRTRARTLVVGGRLRRAARN